MSSFLPVQNMHILFAADAHVGLCKFHRRQAWNRHLANNANKDKLLSL